MTKLSEELAWRGFINQSTFADLSDIDKPRTFYWGVDPSADSMHIGNLAPAMMIRHFMDHGHKAILLVGGATGMIGDPDGKKQERDLLTPDDVDRNKKAIAEQYKSLFAGLDFDVVDNYDWFKGMYYLDFLREIGKHAPMTQMLDRDFVQSRIGEGGEGISYAEFSYALIQGYDFLHLHREKGATLQVAGADQWGNSVTGVQLIRRLEGAEAHVVTAPLIVNKSTGRKFGKTEEGAVWLDPAKTSPYKFYQFWLNVDDETAEELVKIYTLLDRDTIEALIASHRENPAKRELQKTLAYEVTTLVHGEARAYAVEKATDFLFGKSKISSLDNVKSRFMLDEVLNLLESEIPTISLDQADLETTMNKIGNDGALSVHYALVKSGLVTSYSQADKLVKAGAIYIDGEKISGEVGLKGPSIIKKGKNSFVLIR